MVKHLHFKFMLLLCALMAAGGSVWADEYELYSGTITEGDYIVYYNGKAMKNTVSSNRLSYSEITPNYITNIITNPSSDIVWHIAPSGEYFNLYNAAVNQYAASTGADNKAQLLDSGTDNKSLWTVTGTNTYDIINKYNASINKNKYLRNNGTYGFACYSNSTGGALSLYKKKVSVSSLSVKTAPTKTNYKVGETLDLSGLVLNADGSDVSSGYTSSPANGASLSTVGAQDITITYSGKTCTQTIHIGELQSIVIKTPPTKTTYDEGQTFDPTGMVVKATFSDEEDTPTEWQETIETGDFNYSPTAPLTPANTSVTVSFTWNEVEKTASQTISVNAGVPYRVTYNAGTGSCATAYADEASFGAGVTLPTATVDYSGWSFAGWSETATSNTEVAPILYEAGSTYHPTDNTTLYAVYKYVDGIEGQYKRATKLDEITSQSTIVAINTHAGKTLTYDISNLASLSESEGTVTPSEKAIISLTGNNSTGFTLGGNGNTIGASSLPTSNGSSKDISLTSSNNKWIIQKSTCSNEGYDDHFVFKNTNGTNVALEYTDKWVAYRSSSYQSLIYYAFKIYVKAWSVAYNSNPAAIKNPTVAFTTAGDKTLYVQNENSYTNVANVTGISKSAVYTSSDATVATVENGVVTALKSGSTTITAMVAAEVGVNTEATASYIVTVKDASDVAGIKAITDAATVVSFTADLTDAVVTYVSDSYAYIQDASGAVYASCGNSLTAGKKINGAVSGSVKAANQIDEIIAINLSDATLTGVVATTPVEVSLATIIAAGTDYDGKMVKVKGAKVTATLSSGSASGGSITDDGKTTEMNLYAPAKNIEAIKDAEGSFTGFISLYGGSSYRLNIYEQNQIVLTKNAPTAQTLTFGTTDIQIDEDTDALRGYSGQAVEGAHTTVTYDLSGDAIGSVNPLTGVVSLNGDCGTATITATAIAAEAEDENGITTPYTTASATYTITVNPRYIVMFFINGEENVLRQSTSGAAIVVPTPADYGSYKFMGWSSENVAAGSDEPTMTEIGKSITPTANGDEYYAVYARESTSGSGGNYTLDYENESDLYNVSLAYATETSFTATDGGTWIIHAYCSTNSTYGLQINTGKSASIKVPSCPGYITNIETTSKSGAIKAIGFSTSANGTAVATGTDAISQMLDLTGKKLKDGYIIPVGGNNILTKIIVNYGPAIVYSDYRTSLPEEPVTITSAGLATYASDNALDFTDIEGLEVYIAKEESDAIKLHQVNKVPAGTGVLLRATTGGTNFNVPLASSTDDVTGNIFVRGSNGAVATDAGDGKTNYILNIVDNNIGFYKANGKTVATNRAYLQTASSAARIALNFDETQGISTAESRECSLSHSVYSIDGRKVAEFDEQDSLQGQNPAFGIRNSELKKGLYIVNGKKVIIK